MNIDFDAFAEEVSNQSKMLVVRCGILAGQIKDLQKTLDAKNKQIEELEAKLPKE